MLTALLRVPVSALRAPVRVTGWAAGELRSAAGDVAGAAALGVEQGLAKGRAGRQIRQATNTPQTVKAGQGVSVGHNQTVADSGHDRRAVVKAAGIAGRVPDGELPSLLHVRVRVPLSLEAAAAMQASLERVPQVLWARVNTALGAATIATAATPSEHDRYLLRSVVEAASAAPLQAGEPAAGSIAGGVGTHDISGRRHPSDPVFLRRAVLSAGVFAAAGAASVGGRVWRLVPLPAEVSALVTTIDTQPVLRGVLERGIGQEAADLVLTFAAATAQGLTHGTIGVGVDFSRQVLRAVEAQARLTLWRSVEGELAGDPSTAGAIPQVIPRQVPLPAGPIETYLRRAGLVNAAAAGVGYATSRDWRRAASAGLATQPKAAGAGRESFVDGLGRLLARRGVLSCDRAALRRLDRLDVIVIDSAVLRGPGSQIVSVEGLESAPPGLVGEAAARTVAMFDPLDPMREQTTGDWQLSARGVNGLRLSCTGRPVAEVGVTPVAADGAEQLLAAARVAGQLIVVGVAPAGLLRGSDDVRARSTVMAVVRAEQQHGAGVLVITHDGPAAGTADLGLGIAGPSGPAWGAHLLATSSCGSGLGAARLLVAAIPAAKRVSGRSVRLAQAGAGIATAASVTGLQARLSPRALLAMNGAAGAAVLASLWQVDQLARLPQHVLSTRYPWHAIPAPAVLERLGVTPEHGLTITQIGQRFPAVSATPGAGGSGLLRSFAEELANPLTPVLLAGAALSAVVDGGLDAALVLGVGLASALIGALQRQRTENAVAVLLARSAVRARVLRDGVESEVAAEQLVVGDIVLVQADDVVPADLRVLTVAGLEVDESSLTGEPFTVVKTAEPVMHAVIADRRCMLFEGTTVATGRGTGVVVAIGADTEAGRGVAAAGQRRAGGVEARLERLTRQTLPVAGGAAGVVLLAGLAHGRPLRETLSAGVGLAVASVPEGLPFLVSAAQLAAARRLARLGILVRTPRAIEALGRADVLCFDKTGTLTEGRIRLGAVDDGVATFLPEPDADGEWAGPAGPIIAAGLRATPYAEKRRQLSHLTDQAVHRAARDSNVERNAGAPGWRHLASLPFEPARSYHATLASTAAGQLLSVKGAPETVLPRCALPAAQSARLTARADLLAGQGYRVLAVAERQLPAEHPGDLVEETVVELTFRGFLLLSDRVRAGAREALSGLAAAGVHVLILTGDHPSTARAIARDLGLANDQVITGEELDTVEDGILADRLASATVLARCTPAQKVRVVQVLQGSGRAVAMTGDGANDAPAIRLADVGIAIGSKAAPAARAAADLVMLENDLGLLLAAVTEGRALWVSVRSALAILLGGNLGEIAYTTLGALLTGGSPLSARQLLLVNLLTDLAPALAVALRPPTPGSVDLLGEGPERSLGSALTREITVRAAATTAGAALGWGMGRLSGRPRRADTIGLVALVGTQMAQTLLAGGLHPTVCLASGGSLLALAAVVQTPGISGFFGCTPLGPLGWTQALGAAGTATLATVAAPHLIGWLRPDASTTPTSQTGEAVPPDAGPNPRTLRPTGGEGVLGGEDPAR